MSPDAFRLRRKKWVGHSSSTQNCQPHRVRAVANHFGRHSKTWSSRQITIRRISKSFIFCDLGRLLVSRGHDHRFSKRVSWTTPNRQTQEPTSQATLGGSGVHLAFQNPPQCGQFQTHTTPSTIDSRQLGAVNGLSESQIHFAKSSRFCFAETSLDLSVLEAFASFDFRFG